MCDFTSLGLVSAAVPPWDARAREVLGWRFRADAAVRAQGWDCFDPRAGPLLPSVPVRLHMGGQQAPGVACCFHSPIDPCKPAFQTAAWPRADPANQRWSLEPWAWAIGRQRERALSLSWGNPTSFFFFFKGGVVEEYGDLSEKLNRMDLEVRSDEWVPLLCEPVFEVTKKVFPLGKFQIKPHL